ncbi:tRNA uridine-5-carboxymethylaminomethyl(34) synthesis GTPase MnmE [Endothiovibrio diazotrophicus]
MVDNDTIAAIATPPGRGGVGIIRLSGPAVPDIAPALLGHLPPSRHAGYRPFRDADGDPIDHGIALYFPAPNSFTGEEVLELQGHGGPVVMDLLLQRCLVLGARLARPGEFSERAFLNGRMDLAQAEAVADLIDSGSETAARAALRSLEGAFSERVHQLTESLIGLRMYVEAALDFPEEEIDFLSDGKVSTDLSSIQSEIRDLRASTRQGCLLREGMTLVIAGRPNAGKSSLLNRLAGRESAIVTEIPGTTRDLLREEIQLDGMPLHVIDTAGLRETDDPVEREGVRRAWGAIEKADRLLVVVDDRIGIAEEEWAIVARLPERLPVTVARNKIDLTGVQPFERDGELGREIGLSAKQDLGIDRLRRHLEETMGYQRGEEGAFIARRRHLDAIDRADRALAAGNEVFHATGAGELLAEELRAAQEALSEITGEFSSDDLLGRIFSSFCIGK